ncbi:MAG: hypothetical protein HY868_22145 [Chloroflexi bacterium]|nr:hypothetical protein [Chloroflexota bacterium]
MKSETRYFVLTTLLVNAVLLFALGVPVHAKPMVVTFTVNDTTDLIDDNLTDGVCHTTTNTCTLRAAVMQANALGGTNTINLPAGMFVLTIAGNGLDNVGDLDISSNLTIMGSGVVNTVIDGNQTNRVFRISSNYRVAISGLTIRNGKKYDFSAYGGGVYNSGSVILSNVNLDNNSADAGGGIWSEGELVVSDSQIINNTSWTMGGGIMSNGSLSLTNTLIKQNVVTDTTTGLGGGLAISGQAELTNVTVSSNSAPFHSGGIANGGILTVTNSSIVGNSSLNYSAAIFSSRGSTLTLTASTVSSNTTGFGLISISGNASLTNVTISGNTAQAGAGIENAGNITLTNVTINGNQATNPNGIAVGVYNSYNVDSVVRLKNTIIASNGTTPNCLSDMGLGIISLGHNISTDSSCNLNATGDKPTTNPLLGSLANNGGATQTHALLSGSPAINTGDNNGCPSTDQRGQSRVGTCDIGAYEYGLPTAVAVNSFAAYNDHTGLPRLFLLGIIVIGGVVIAGSVRARRRDVRN